MFFRTFLLIYFSFGVIYAQETIKFSTKEGFPSNNVYEVIQDLQGNMWFATNRGIVKYNGSRIKIFTIKDGLPNNDIWGLEVDNSNKIWFFSKSNFQGFIKNDVVNTFRTENNEVINPSIIHSNGENIWMRTLGSIYSFEDNMIKRIVDIDTIDYSLFDLKSINRERVIFIPETDNTIVYNEEEIGILNKEFEPLASINLNFESRTILTRGALRNQKFFIVFSSGIVFVDLNTLKIKQISFEELIDSKQVSYAFVRSTKSKIQISIPEHLIVYNENFSFDNIYNFSEDLGMSKKYRDRDGNVWKTDLSKGVELFTAPVLKTKYDLIGKKTQKINQLDSTLYVGVKNDYFFYLDNNSQKFISEKSLKSASDVYQIGSNTATNDKYFISSNKSYKINSKDTTLLRDGTKSIRHFQGKEYLLSTFLVYRLDNFKITKIGLTQLESFSKKLYVSGSDGLYFINKDSLARPALNDEILQVPINCLSANQNYLFAGTDGRGVFLYNEKEVIPIKSTEGLIVQKIIHRRNELWLASQNGVKLIQLDSASLENSKITNSFYETDGLLQNNVNDIFIKDDFLYALSDIGLARVSIKDPVYLNKPKLQFNSKSDTLDINFSDNKLNISFSTIDYVNQQNFKYEYRLLPHQKEWVQTPVSVLNFNNLNPGLHTLEVKVVDQHNNQTIEKQFIRIVPKWWQTMLFNFIKYLLGFILLIGILYLINRGIRRSEIKKTQQEKRLIALELQALRSQMNPHFVHNSLNAIVYFIQRNEKILSEKYLLKISKLVRTYYNYSKKRKIKIKDEIDLLKNYLDIEKLRFEDKLEYIIEVDEDLDIENQEIPSMLLQPIVENAINHGIFHKEEKGLVMLQFKKKSVSKIEISIEDNGVGIKKAKEFYAEFSQNHDSRSSAILRERLELLKMSKEWNITMEIEDISKNHKETGTLVTLTFDISV